MTAPEMRRHGVDVREGTELATVTRISTARNYVDAGDEVPEADSDSGSNVVPLKIR